MAQSFYKKKRAPKISSARKNFAQVCQAVGYVGMIILASIVLAIVVKWLLELFPPPPPTSSSVDSPTADWISSLFSDGLFVGSSQPWSPFWQITVSVASAVGTIVILAAFWYYAVKIARKFLASIAYRLLKSLATVEIITVFALWVAAIIGAASLSNIAGELLVSSSVISLSSLLAFGLMRGLAGSAIDWRR
jgi:hypothetical protein